MKESVIIDGRNILDIKKIKEANIKAYYSIGKGNIKNLRILNDKRLDFKYIKY